MKKNVYTEIINDLDNAFLPENINNIDKLKCDICIGTRINWYYKEDLEFAKEHDYKIIDDCPYSGIIVPRHDIHYSGGDLELDEAIVIIDHYPCEKEYPIIEWIALNKLLDEENLIEIIN